MKKKYYWIAGIVAVLILVSVWLIFISYSNTSITATEMKVERIVYPDVFKGILLEINIANNKFTLLNYEIVDSGYPDYLPGSYPFVARIFSSDGNLLGEYGFGDPRIVQAEQGYTGPTWLDNVNFTLTLPYFNNSKIVKIYSATKLMLSVDIS